MSAEPVEPDVTASPFVVLSGDGLVLRCLRQRDVAALLAGEDDEQVRWLLEGQRSELERTRRRAARPLRAPAPLNGSADGLQSQA